MHQFGSRKVVIVGAGHVGSHVAAGLLSNQLVDEIVFIDVNEAAATGEVFDLKDFCTALNIHTLIRTGTFDDCADARFLIITAGSHRRPGQSRRDMLEGTLKIMGGIVGPIRSSGFDGTLVSVSNPADVVAEYLYRSLDLPRSRCFGTGTALDSYRLQRIIGNLIGMERSQVQAFVMGEHGDSSFVSRSHVTLGGMMLDEYLRIRPEQAEVLQFGDITSAVRGAGAAIISGKGVTEFGIGGTVASIVAAILHNERRVISVSAHLRGEYGEHDVSAGVPCLIGAKGIEKIYEFELTEDELAALRASCDIIREGIDAVSA